MSASHFKEDAMSGQSVKSNAARNDIVATLQTVHDATQKYFGKGKTLVLDGVDVKSDAFVAELQNVIATYKAVDTARTALTQAVLARRQALEAVRPKLTAMRAYVAAICGKQSTEYKAFGFAPQQRQQASLTTRAGAVEKMRATRKARGIMGKRQRQQIQAAPPPATTPSSASSPAGSAAVPSTVVTTTTTNGGSR
jgi:hypothetical protein